MAEADPVYDEDDTFIGYRHIQPDGLRQVWDTEQNFLGAMAPDGTFYEPDELEDADDIGEGYEYDAEAEAFEQRLADLEARADEPTGFIPIPVAAEPDPEVQAAQLHQQAEHWQRVHGRPLTLSERRRLGEALMENEVAGEAVPDLQGAADRLAAEGRPLLDIDSGSAHEQRRKRQALMSELLSDRERIDQAEQNDDDLTSDIAPPSQPAYDLDSRSERHAYLSDRLRGATDPDSTFASETYADDASLG